MNFIKIAFLYTFRKWQQSLILFLILLAISTAALTGLALLDASHTAAANLRGQLGGTFDLKIDMSNSANMQNAQSTSQYTGTYYQGDIIDTAVIHEVLKTPGISAYSANIESVAGLKSTDGTWIRLLENEQNDYSSADAHIAPIQGWTSLQQCPYFAKNLLKITEGTLFSNGYDAAGANTAKAEAASSGNVTYNASAPDSAAHDASVPGKAVISRELAQQNQLALGSQLTLVTNRESTGIDFPQEKQECTFEIIGIFDIAGEQKIDQFTGQRQMLQNWIFVDSGTLLPYLNELLESIGMPPIGYEKVTFSVQDPAEMEAIIQNIQQNPSLNWDCFKIEKDDEAYQSIADVLGGMDHSLRMMIRFLPLAGTAILILLLTVWSKFRTQETGILLSIGQSRWQILAQRMAEVSFILFLAFACSYAIGSPAAGMLGGKWLAQLNQQLAAESPAGAIQPEMPVTAEEMDLSPVFAPPEIEAFSISVTARILASVYLPGLLIALISVCAAGIPVLKMKPKEILLQ